MHARLCRGPALAAVVVTLAVSLASCGDDAGHGDHGDVSAARTAGNGDVFNDADVVFASHMVQHHAQAVQMVVMTRGRPLDPEVQQLAEDIRTAQVPEIELMSDWLTSWGEEVPRTSLDHGSVGHSMDDLSGSMEGMDMPDMPGAMTAEDMEALETASDADFQDRWLALMTEHHEGAVEMAQAEQEEGVHEEAVALAGTIVETQRAEIAAMSDLRG